MKFFNRFPKIDYKFGSLKTTNEYTNLSVYVDIIDQIKDDATTYELYQIQDGERPDVISDRLYGNSIYGWTFYILNDHIREQGWPLSYADLREYITETLPGVCFEISGTNVNSSGVTQHKMTEQFPIGTNVFGTLSGATGVVYNRNVNLGQLFVTCTSVNSFSNGEIINDVASGSPTYSLTTDSVSLAYQAIHHYEDEDGTWIDIDPTTCLNPSGYMPVTYEEYMESQNEGLSRIKVLKPGLISRFASLYKEALER